MMQPRNAPFCAVVSRACRTESETLTMPQMPRLRRTRKWRLGSNQTDGYRLHVCPVTCRQSIVVSMTLAATRKLSGGQIDFVACTLSSHLAEVPEPVRTQAQVSMPALPWFGILALQPMRLHLLNFKKLMLPLTSPSSIHFWDKSCRLRQTLSYSHNIQEGFMSYSFDLNCEGRRGLGCLTSGPHWQLQPKTHALSCLK